MNENYIVINGKKIELTAEQLKALGVEIEEKKKNPFERVPDSEVYYYSTGNGIVHGLYEKTENRNIDDYNAANYFNDEAFAKQVALHQLLYRKLLKFAYDNECEDEAEWNGSNSHFAILYDVNCGTFTTCFQMSYKAWDVYFSTEKDAECAIKEVVEPFVKEHPEFTW